MATESHSDPAPNPGLDTLTIPPGLLTLPGSDDELLAQFSEQLVENREKYQRVVAAGTPEHSRTEVDTARRWLLHNEHATPDTMLAEYRGWERQTHERDQLRQKQEQEAARKAAHAVKSKAWKSFIAARGKRYESCRLDNFTITADRQREVVDRLQEYGRTIKDSVTAGDNVLLLGPKGSGKDHLLTGLVHIAIGTIAGTRKDGYAPDTGDYRARFVVGWTSGARLFGSLRSAMRGGEQNEEDIVRPLINADILVLSDLLPPCGALSAYQAEIVYQIIDERYSAIRPTWCSFNVASRDQMATGLGEAVVDRLVDGAIVLPCDWASHRRARP